MGNGEGAMGARTLGVHAPLGDHLAVEVGELLEEPDILQQLRATRPGGHDILVVDDRATGVGGEFLLVTHDVLLQRME